MNISVEFYEMILEALHNQKVINKLPQSERGINQYLIDRVYKKAFKKLEKHKNIK